MVISVAACTRTKEFPDKSVYKGDIKGGKLNGRGRMWRLSGPNLTAMAGLTHKEVQLMEMPVNEAPKTFRVAPLSIEMYEFDKAP